MPGPRLVHVRLRLPEVFLDVVSQHATHVATPAENDAFEATRDDDLLIALAGYAELLSLAVPWGQRNSLRVVILGEVF